MKFLEIIFGKLLDFFFKKDEKSGVSVVNKNSQSQIRDIINAPTVNSNNETIQQNIYINSIPENTPILPEEEKRREFWFSIGYSFFFGVFIFLGSSLNILLNRAFDILDYSNIILLASLIIAFVFRRNYKRFIDRLAEKIKANKKTKTFIFYMDMNIHQVKVIFTLLFGFIASIIAYYITNSTLFFLAA